MSKSWKLKILTGPYLGVVVDLPKGKFTMGADDTKADLVIVDYGLSASHLLFEVNEDDELHVVLLDKKSELIINSNIAEEERFLVKDSSILSTETMNFAVVFGDDSQWPEFKPTGKQAEAIQKQADKAATEGDIGSKVKRKRPLNPLVKSLLITLVILFIVVSPISVLLVSDTLTDDTGVVYKKSSSKANVAEGLSQFRRLVTNAGYHNIVASLSGDSTSLLVSGYVETRAQQQEVVAILRQIGLKPVVQIRVMENIIQSVNSILQRNGFKGLEAYGGDEPGIVVLKGYINDYSKFNNLETELNTKVLGLKSWNVEYVDSRKLLVIFRRMLAVAGIEDVHQIEMDDKKLIVRSDLDATKSKLFYQQAEYFRRRYNFSPILEPYTKQMSESELSISSVEIGRNAVVILKGGKTYLIGSRLPNGFIIKDINRKGITMIKGTKAMFYSFGVLDHDGNE